MNSKYFYSPELVVLAGIIAISSLMSEYKTKR